MSSNWSLRSRTATKDILTDISSPLHAVSAYRCGQRFPTPLSFAQLHFEKISHTARNMDLTSLTGGRSDYKSCDSARVAFTNRDIQASRREHLKPMHMEGHNKNASEYVKSVVFGGLDGIMTTFAVIAAAAGSNGTFATVLIFGFSNVIADGFSMGFGEYVSGEAERENASAERRREEWEVENSFDLEVDEMVQIYMSRGLSFDDASTIVGIISKDPKLFVDFMMVEELGLLVDLDDYYGPMKQGLAMFASFVLFGSIPLIAYLPRKGQGTDAVFYTSTILTMISLIGLGYLKGHLVGLNKLRSAALMLLNGFITGSVSFLAGHLIEIILREGVSI